MPEILFEFSAFQWPQGKIWVDSTVPIERRHGRAASTGRGVGGM